MSSLLFHVILGTSYLYLKHMQDSNMLLLENIEFIEIHPDIVQPAQDICMPKQAPPKNVMDFIKMALPTFKKPELQDVAEPELQEKIKPERMEKIDMSKAMDKPLETKISLKERKIAETRELSDIVPDKSPDTRQVAALLKSSIEYSLSNREQALDYAIDYGRGLDREKADRFVGMYVNELTVEYGDRGQRAGRAFLERAFSERLIPKVPQLDFL